MNKFLLWIENIQLTFLANGILKLEKKFDQMNAKLLKTMEKEEVKHDEKAKKKALKIIKLEQEIDENKSNWDSRRMELDNKRSHVVKVKKVLGGE